MRIGIDMGGMSIKFGLVNKKNQIVFYTFTNTCKDFSQCSRICIVCNLYGNRQSFLHLCHNSNIFPPKIKWCGTSRIRGKNKNEFYSVRLCKLLV